LYLRRDWAYVRIVYTHTTIYTYREAITDEEINYYSRRFRGVEIRCFYSLLCTYSVYMCVCVCVCVYPLIPTSCCGVPRKLVSNETRALLSRYQIRYWKITGSLARNTILYRIFLVTYTLHLSDVFYSVGDLRQVYNFIARAITWRIRREENVYEDRSERSRWTIDVSYTFWFHSFPPLPTSHHNFPIIREYAVVTRTRYFGNLPTVIGFVNTTATTTCSKNDDFRSYFASAVLLYT